VVKLNEAEPPMVSRLGLMTLGIFIGLVIALGVVVHSTQSDMAGIAFIVVAVPWIILALFLGPGAFEFGFIVGFALNLILAYCLGAFIERRWRRRRQQRGAAA
jgi:hypothetical protein